MFLCDWRLEVRMGTTASVMLGGVDGRRGVTGEDEREGNGWRQIGSAEFTQHRPSAARTAAALMDQLDL